MSNFDQIATEFVNYYYQTFDNNRPGLKGLYREFSMLSFEGNQCQGSEAISTKLISLPFQKVEHKVESIDAQPSHPDGGYILVHVTGQLIVEGSDNPLKFSQVFNLVAEGGGFFVLNDIFRLVYG